MWPRGVLPWASEEAQGCFPLHQPTLEWARAWEKCLSKSLLLPRCPAEMLKGLHSAVQHCAKIRPQRKGCPDFPHLRRVQVLFSAEGPWAPRGQQDCACHRHFMGGKGLSCWRVSRGCSSVEERPLCMREVLGSIPSISMGCFCPESPGSGRCGLELGALVLSRPCGPCPAHPGLGCEVRRALCAASAEPPLGGEAGSCAGPEIGSLPCTTDPPHPPPRDNAWQQSMPVGRSQAGDRGQQHTRNPFWLQ